MNDRSLRLSRICSIFRDQLHFSMLKELRKVVAEIVHLRDTTDVRGTIDSVRRSIAIKGYNIWILACGAMLASIGLDTNSAAVIIGAMLISPLMSPILGIGMSIAINDREHLMLALENFAVAVVASLGVATLYFLVTPLGTITPEITARTYPTFLDVLIAIFGGIAGIVAGSRKDKTNAIPGVAIATALMPPICVAGFGLANFNLNILGGALYLFFINSVFIALSTYLIARFLRFPYVEYVDEGSRRKAIRWITAFAIIIILPSGYFFYNLIQRVRVEGAVQSLIEEKVNNRNHEAVRYKIRNEAGDSLKVCTLVISGSPISEDSMAYLRSILPEYNLGGFQLNFVQAPDIQEEELLKSTTLEVIDALQPLLASRDQRLDSLERRLAQQPGDTVQLGQFRREVQLLFPEVEALTMSRQALAFAPTNEQAPDTLSVLLLEWKKGMKRTFRRQQQTKIEPWLRQRLSYPGDSLRILHL